MENWRGHSKQHGVICDLKGEGWIEGNESYSKTGK